MLTKNMLKSKKAISPILATLLLIVIAVAAVVVTYAWVMTYMSSAGHQAGIMLSKDANCLWQTGNVTIYVRNRGTEDAEIDRVYIDSQPQSDVSYNPTTKIVKSGEAITIVVTYSWISGDTYNFQISPKQGEPLGFYEKAP
jgi:flagellin-like protein